MSISVDLAPVQKAAQPPKAGLAQRLGSSAPSSEVLTPLIAFPVWARGRMQFPITPAMICLHSVNGHHVYLSSRCFNFIKSNAPLDNPSRFLFVSPLLTMLPAHPFPFKAWPAPSVLAQQLGARASAAQVYIHI